MRFLLIKNVKLIGEETISQQTRSVKIAVFLTQFINTAILLLVYNANLTEHGFPFFSQILKGRFTDFSEDWYKDIGVTIVKALMIAAVLPVFEVLGFYVLGWVKL